MTNVIASHMGNLTSARCSDVVREYRNNGVINVSKPYRLWRNSISVSSISGSHGGASRDAARALAQWPLPFVRRVATLIVIRSATARMRAWRVRTRHGPHRALALATVLDCVRAAGRLASMLPMQACTHLTCACTYNV